MTSSPSPCLYEINTRIALREAAARLGRDATLDDLGDEYLDRVADLGLDWVWLLGVWRIGPAGRQESLTNADWRRGYAVDLPDFTDDDISGSPFAVREYTVDTRLGGPAALARLRQRLTRRGLRLMLDFVPNHTALDHPWAKAHPEYYVQANDDELHRQPRNYIRLDTDRGPVVFAHGRDPYFPGWPDTLQLNYRHAAMRAALLEQLKHIADQCDGIRCDMAMLMLPDIFRRTWRDAALPRDGTAPVDDAFWPWALTAVRERQPNFVCMAEVYWDLEYALQQQGFDFTYDKRLYDCLRDRDTEAIRGHLHADLAFQQRSARFLENHDEPRAAAAFAPGMHQAAAVVTFLVPGLRFFHEGQFEGRRVHASIHLNRRPVEAVDGELAAFYRRLLDALRSPIVRKGQWRLLECRPAWDGNPTAEQFLAFAWQAEGALTVVAVNYAAAQGQCYVSLPFESLPGRTWLLRDALGAARYERDGADLANRGLYLDQAPWGYHVFEVV